MTTHRNLKPHYAERKGKSGPVIRIPAPLSDSMTEDELLQATTDALTIYGWRWHHVRRSDKAQQMGHAGFPDIYAVHPKDGRLLFVELKSEKGQLDVEQYAWQLALDRAPRGNLWSTVLRPSGLDRFIRDGFVTTEASAA